MDKDLKSVRDTIKLLFKMDYLLALQTSTTFHLIRNRSINLILHSIKVTPYLMYSKNRHFRRKHSHPPITDINLTLVKYLSVHNLKIHIMKRVHNGWNILISLSFCRLPGTNSKVFIFHN